ncbi:MAG: YoaK family protein [Leptolyngbya sp. BL-A-14]
MAALRNERFTTTLLGWVAGYVDTAGFLGLDGLFTAHVTGNLVVAGVEFAGKGGDAVWVRLAMIPVFIAAVVTTTVGARQQQLRLSSLLWFEAIALLAFLGVSTTIKPDVTTHAANLPLFLAGSTGVFAMGIQNALMRESLGTLAPTTVMTGNLTQLVIDIVQLVLARYNHRQQKPVLQPEVRTRIAKFGSALFGFSVGAASGGVITRWIGLGSILLPAIAIAGLAMQAQKQDARPS